MSLAAVPEAAVNHYRDSAMREREIWCAREAKMPSPAGYFPVSQNLDEP